VLLGFFLGFTLLAYQDTMSTKAQAEEIIAVEQPLPREVRIEVKINWTRERIEREIRETFPESPETALKIAKCESGFDPDIQSHHIGKDGKQEPSYGIFQIHSPSWHARAKKLGLEDYRTDPGDNIKMARHIFDGAGKKWTDWSCYTKRMI
jgi:soluble lytic murein transglycosylase-like protein